MLIQDWMELGSCRGVTTNIFFPEPYEVPSQAARRLCRRCPVKQECLQYALDHGEVGIWGNTTDADRAKMLRSRHRVYCPGCKSNEVVELVPHSEVCLSCGVSWPI